MLHLLLLATVATVATAPASDSANARWHARRDNAIRVWIAPTPRLADRDDGYRASVRSAFMEWNRIGLPLRFRFTRDSASADVRVTWTHRFDEPMSGRTRTTHFDAARIVEADVLLAEHHADGARLSAEEMRVLALHEIGHVLGLDHSDDFASVMSPTVRVRGLSKSDRTAARRRYAR